MIRDDYIIEDIQKIMVYLIKKMITDTWTRWEVIFGYPEQAIFEKFTKPFIYIMAPTEIDGRLQQGGRGRCHWEMTIGLWDDRQTGGSEEINIQGSKLHNFFKTSQTCHAKQFNVILGATTYTNTTLKAQGIRILNIKKLKGDIFTEDIKEFRNEYILTLDG